MTPEVLAKLTASSVDTTQIRVDGQSIPTHTVGEIAGALAHCSEGAQLYASVFFMGADEYRDWLMGEIRLALAGVSAERGWELRHPGMLEGLSWLAIADETPESVRCPTCGGIGSKTIRSRVIDCRGCGGTGRRGVVRPHEYLGVNRRNWERTWRERYERYVRPIMEEWRWEVRMALLRQLRIEEYGG